MTNLIFDATVRKPFRFMPDIVWAMLIDAIDIVPAIVNTILTAVGGVGIGLDVLVDGAQMVCALIIFENPGFAIANPDLLIPAPFDIFPSYTAKVLLKSNKTKKSD